MKFAIAIAFALTSSVLFASQSLVLAERGKVSDYAIIVRSEACACEKYAAQELSDFIFKQTDVRLAVTNDSASLPQRAIFIGETLCTKEILGEEKSNLGEDGFRLKSNAGNLFVRGAGARGSLYGVYELLERFGSCAWYSLRFQKVPRLDKFCVPGNLDEVQRPSFELRTENWNGFGRELEFAARNKLNLESFGEKLGGSRYKFDSELGICHTFEKLLSAEKLFDSHPEYFSEIDGVRIKRKTQLCLTNPDVLRLSTEKVMERIAESYPKGVRRYGISPNDWMNACECKNCAAVDRSAGSKSGTLIQFVNKIAEEVEKKYPDVFIQTLAYSYSRHPPVGIVPRKNVEVCLCTIECDFSKSIKESRALENRRVRHDFSVWGKFGCKLSVWDYSINFGCYNHVWPNYDAMAGNMRFFREQGVSEIFSLNNGGGDNDVWSNIRCWLLAKLMWNAEADVNALLRKCFRDHFGAAADDVWEYYELLCKAPRDTRRYPMGCFVNVYSGGIETARLERGAEILERAMAKVKGSEWEENLRLARVPVDFMLVMRGAGRPRLSPKPQDRAAWLRERDAARRLAAVMDMPGALAFSDDIAGRTNFTTRIRALSAAQEFPDDAAKRRLTLDETYLTGDFPQTTFKYVDDPDAKDARAVMLPGKLSYCTAWLDLASLDLDKDSLYAIRARIKTSQCPEGSVPFRAGVYNCFQGRGVSYFQPGAHDIRRGMTKYRWYNVGVVSPKRSDALWIGLGGGADPNGKSCDVWIDRIEIVRIGDK